MYDFEENALRNKFLLEGFLAGVVPALQDHLSLYPIFQSLVNSESEGRATSGGVQSVSCPRSLKGLLKGSSKAVS